MSIDIYMIIAVTIANFDLMRSNQLSVHFALGLNGHIHSAELDESVGLSDVVAVRLTNRMGECGRWLHVSLDVDVLEISETLELIRLVNMIYMGIYRKRG
jgi:hypothetical protein